MRLNVAPRDKFAVIPYGFDLPAHVDAAAGETVTPGPASASPDDAFVLGWAGRLTAIKRPLDLIRVAAGVEGALLVLVGDGEDREAAEALAE